MKYAEGQIGRVFVAQVEHGDDLLLELKNLVEKENIEAGLLYAIGALKEASMVAGPEECTRPPVPVWRKFNDCREILGVGTMFRDEGTPVFHLHAATGKGDTSIMGCIRGETEVYLIIEVVILEIKDSGAIKQFDEQTGLKMLNII